MNYLAIHVRVYCYLYIYFRQQQHCKKTSKWATTYMYYVGVLFMLPLKEKK
jgi:hypothetical protein